MTPIYNIRQCKDHYPVQHRDAKPPWCAKCGLTADFQRPEAMKSEANRILQTTTYVVKPARMEVVLLTKDNLEAAARWTGGEVMDRIGEEVRAETAYLAFPTMAGLFHAHPGMLLARMEDGKFCCIDQEDLENNWVVEVAPPKIRDFSAPTWLEN